MKSRFKWITAFLLTAVMIAACGQSDTTVESTADETSNGSSSEQETMESSGTEVSESENELTFVYVVRDTGSIYSQYITDFEEACEAEGVNPVIISYEDDTSKWATALENAVTIGADAVYTWPDDQSMADYAAEYYQEQGIPHCVMGIFSENADLCLLGDQEAMGTTLAEDAAAWVEENWGDEPFEWALLEYTSAEHVATRSQAMEDTFTELCENGTQVAALEAQTLDEGMTQTENLLQMYPDLKLLICCEDTAAMGAVEVFRANGKTGDDYAIFGAVFGDQVGNAIIAGDVYRESIAFDRFGSLVVESLIKLCNGEEVERDLYGGFITVTQENVEEVMDYFGYEIIE